MNKKRILILISVIALFAVIGVIFWFVSKKSSVPGKERIFQKLFPSTEERKTEQQGKEGLEGELPGPERKEKDFICLSQSPVSGAANTENNSVRYAEKSTGHIYDISPVGKDKNRKTNTTILKTFEVFWSSYADKMIIRYFDGNGDIKNFSAIVATSSATSSLEAVFLPSDIIAIAVSPLDNSVFYLQKTDKANLGILTDFKNEKKTAIFSSSFGEFNINWPGQDIIAFFTKPSCHAEGYLYFLNIKTKEFRKIIGKIKGLLALVSPDAEKIIYSESPAKTLKTKVFNVKENEHLTLGLITLPDKCVWSKKNGNLAYCGAPLLVPSADYPDDWYQGLVSFDDSIYKIDVSTGQTDILLQDSKSDIIKPFLTADENYFIFINKKDGTLWSLKLE